MTKSAAMEADGATRRVLEALLHDRQDLVIVPSPPGAGKTSLVESVVATAVHLGLRVGAVAPKVEQTFDFLRRIRADYVDFRIQLLHSSGREVPGELSGNGIACVTDAALLAGGPGLTVATAAKMFFALEKLQGSFDLLVCDEAYQIPAKELLPLYDRAKQVLLVGDPGQLRPIVKSDVARFEAAPAKVHWPAPLELLNRHPATTQIPLPATWRLPQDTVDFVQPSFYPELQFISGANPTERRLTFGACGTGGAVDRALDLLASGKTLAAILLPQSDYVQDSDEELAELVARIFARMFERQPQWNGKVLGPSDCGYVDAHVASNAEVQRQLRSKNIGPELEATTPEIWQGRERPIMVAKHTLSGLKEYGEFELEPGRLCVMASRHKLGCLIVARDGIRDSLENHNHNCADWPSGAESLEWRGWNANREFWRRLEDQGRVLRI